MAAPMGTRIGTTSRIGRSSPWLLLVFGLLLAAEGAAAAVKVQDTRLIQLHVLWRHGNRTRVRADTYSTDPYKDVPDPNGVGNLNRNGLIKAYELGQELRRRYDTFLGPDYLPNIHRVRSTDKRRTGDSAMLVMAGLFPPGPKEKWHSTGVGVIGRLWQPIDIDMPRLRTDNLLATIDQDCPPLWAAHQAARVSEEVHQDELKVSQNGRIFEYVSVNSGDHINDSYIMQGVHNALLCEEDQGWELPAWTLPVYPEPLRTLSGIGLGLFGRTKQLQRLVAGPFLHHLINASEHAGDADAPKFLGYSGHDNNLVALMGAFGLKDLSNTMPKYSADLAWEVRQDSLTNATYIRILYEGEELRLPACNLESLCTLQQLKESLSDVIVTREQQRKECKP